MEPRHASLPEEWLSVGEVAVLLSVTVETVRRWSDSGLIPHRQPAAGYHRRYRRADVEAFKTASEQHAEQAS